MKMSFAYDQKEDLRRRMADLEQKLAESEEERKRLEKTCSLLMRAFKEEEKMHYKTLNNKYEKFLEDCNLRRRRNDIILRSLCRVEDRARALYSKTERLKLLKDRYVSYLKPLELKKEDFLLTRKTFSSSEPTVEDDATSKSVHWKSPNVADIVPDHNTKETTQTGELGYLDDNRKGFYNNLRLNEPSDEFRKTVQNHNDSLIVNNTQSFQPTSVRETQKENILNRTLHNEEHTRTLTRQDKSNLKEISNADKPLSKLITEQIKDYTGRNDKSIEGKNEKFDYGAGDRKWGGVILEGSSDLESRLTSLEKVTAVERGVIRHQESIEKLKTALSFEEDAEKDERCLDEVKNQKVVEKDEIENNEKDMLAGNPGGFLKPGMESPRHSSLGRSLVDEREELNGVEDEVPSAGDLPMGLDGVDYQNETYPESYYEQPVHHDNYFNIASNVILEEDEYEQEVEQREEERSQNTSIKSDIFNGSGLGSFKKEYRQSTDVDLQSPKSTTGFPRSNVLNGNPLVKSHDSDRSLEESEGKVSGLSGHQAVQDGSKGDSAVKKPQAGLMHLLESDSESFQIEHGSANDDSDFDFSFHQN